MTIAEIADDTCIVCAKVKANTRTVEPWGVLCVECDDDMATAQASCEDHGVMFGPCRYCLFG